MPTYRVTSPDGHTYEVTAPNGASQADVLAYAQANATAEPRTPSGRVTYTMTGPDGRDYSIDGPPGATQAQVAAEMQTRFGQAAASPQDRARAAGQQAGAQEGGVLAGIRGFASAATFGANDLLNAGARYVGQRLTGVQHPDDFATDLAFSRGQEEGAANAHPVASTIGSLGGAVATGGALAKGAAKVAAKVAPKAAAAMELQPHQLLRNVLRVVGSGALAGGEYGVLSGGVQGAEDTGTPSGAAQGAATGGVTGAIGGAVTAPIGVAGAAGVGALIGGYEGYQHGGVKGAGYGATGGAAAGLLARRAGAAQKRAWGILADKLGMDADQVVQMVQDVRDRTGRPARIADILDAKQQADLADYTNARQSSGLKMQSENAADLSSLQLSLPAQIAKGGATDTPFGFGQRATAAYDEMIRARNAEMDAAMGPRDLSTKQRAPGSLGTQVVGTGEDAESYLQLPDVLEAEKLVPGLASTLKRHLTARDVFTVDDIDSLRQDLNRVQSTAANTNYHAGIIVGKIRSDLVDGARQLFPSYGDALDRYARQQKFIEGYEHGVSGKSIHDAPDIAATPEGAAGVELGSRTLLVHQAGKTETSALSTANQLRQNAPPSALGNLPEAERQTLQQLGETEIHSRRSVSALTPGSVPSSGEESAQALKTAGEVGYAMHGHVTSGFQAHAIFRLLRQLSISERVANAVTENIVKPYRTPQDDASLRNMLNNAKIAADKRRLLLKQVARYAGAAGGAAARIATQ